MLITVVTKCHSEKYSVVEKSLDIEEERLLNQLSRELKSVVFSPLFITEYGKGIKDKRKVRDKILDTKLGVVFLMGKTVHKLFNMYEDTKDEKNSYFIFRSLKEIINKGGEITKFKEKVKLIEQQQNHIF